MKIKIRSGLRIDKLFLLLIAFSIFTQLYTQEQADQKNLYEMSLEELMNVQINLGTLTGIEMIKTPGSITTITKEDIQATPHRNLLDLLEVYVPSATYVNHWLGPRIGIRGVMSDQNYSYLLLVNGENMNLQVENGPIFEIQNKDLSDIEKIEIISGPGSVIHGPGAIGGIISITTKNVHTTDKKQVGITSDFTYRYFAINGNYSVKKKNYAAYLFSSISTSKGIEDPEFYYIDRAHGYGYGYMSETFGNFGLGAPAPNFYADFQNRPEFKINLEIDFLKEFIFRARYTNFSFIKQQQKTGSEDGPAFAGIYGQQFTSSLVNNHSFSEKTKWKNSISFQSQNHGDIPLYQGVNKPFNDITQRRMSYSENKINFRSILFFQSSSKLKLAFGSEFNYWYYRPEWGKAENSFVLDFPSPIQFAVLDTTSGFYTQYNPNGIVTHIEKDIVANQISGFFEVNYQPLKNTTLIASGRMDKHNLADLAFSPRVALIQQLNKNNFLKLITQQSVRLPGFRELYAANYSSGNASAPEKLQGIELIFTHIQNKNFKSNASVFYQSIDQIAWIDDDKSGLIGTFETAGLEVDISYKTKKLNLNLSYSYISQLSWKPESEFVSYLSDIGIDSLDITLEDAGNNRINNVPQHQIKLATSYSINKSMHIHFNGRFATEYGQLDMLNMYKDIHDEYGLEVTKNEMTAIFNDIQDKGYGKPSFTSNMSFSYKLPFKSVNLSLSASIMNLIAFNHIRYVYQYWEDGDNRQYPRQVGFVAEPRTFCCKLQMEF